MDARWRTALILVVLCVVAYLGNGRYLPLPLGGDTIPNRLIPFSILRFGTVTLEPFRGPLENAHTVLWYTRTARGKLISVYPIGGAIAALPFYVPSYAFLALCGWTTPSLLLRASARAEKYASAMMTALAVGAFYLTVRRRLAARQAFWFAIAFGLGSLMWASASQMLWQQTVVAFCVTFALWFLTWPHSSAWPSAAAGAFLGVAVATRPSAGLFLLAGLATLIVRRRNPLWFIAASIPPIAFTFAVSWYFVGSTSGIYDAYLPRLLRDIVTLQRTAGIAGLLVSPNRGLLIYTPIAILGIWGLVKSRDPLLISFGLASLVHLILFGSFEFWYGGSAFGPRYLVDILPVLGLGAADVWNRLPSWVRRAAIPALAWSVLVEIIGVICYPSSNWFGLNAPRWQAAVWEWSNFSLWQDFHTWLQSSYWVAPWGPT